MASIKVILYTHKTYTDNTHPIIIQIIDGKSIKRKVVNRCLIGQWDSKTNRVNKRHPNASIINLGISEKYNEIEKAMLMGDDPMVRSSIKTLAEVLASEKTRLTEGIKIATLNHVIALENDLIGFYPSLSIQTKLINASWLNNLVGRLMNIPNGDTTISKKITILQKLIKENGGQLSDSAAKFKHKATKSVKQKLTRAEFDRIANAILLPGSMMEAARDLFVLQVYLRGIRVGDLLQARSDNFKNGRFTYRDDKTKGNYDIKLIPQAAAIVDVYMNKHERLFPFFEWSPNPKKDKFPNEKSRLKAKESATAVVNNLLKSIAIIAEVDKPISSHMARHTYAKLADTAIKNPMITMDLLGHGSLGVHQRYLEEIRKDDELDNAADGVF